MPGRTERRRQSLPALGARSCRDGQEVILRLCRFLSRKDYWKSSARDNGRIFARANPVAALVNLGLSAICRIGNENVERRLVGYFDSSKAGLERFGASRMAAEQSGSQHEKTGDLKQRCLLASVSEAHHWSLVAQAISVRRMSCRRGEARFGSYSAASALAPFIQASRSASARSLSAPLRATFLAEPRPNLRPSLS